MATETRSPGTLANDNSAGTNSWTNASNAGASDNVYATVGGGPMSNSQYLKGTNFSFATIGDSDALTQLKLRVERKLTSGGTIKDENVYLVIGGTIQTGTNYADTSTAYPGSDTYAEYTITTGLPTIAQLKASGFGFVVKCKDSSGFGWGVSVDHMEVVATYTVLDPKTFTPATATLTLTTFAPVIRLDKIVKPATKALTLTTFAPTSLISGAVIVEPSPATLTLTTFAPVIRLNKIVTPPTKALTLTAFVPVIRVNQVFTPGTKALTLTAFAPTILTPRVVRPSTLALLLATFAPVFTVQSRWRRGFSIDLNNKR